MSAPCCEHETPPAQALAPANLARYRKILWVALIVNAALFAVEIAAGLQAGSLSLLADAIDFAGDATNYAVSLAVLASALAWRARAAILKALSMMAFGLFILGRTVWAVWHGAVPEAMTMGVVAVLALTANLGVAWLLYAWREGDANMRSVWLCTRNDAIGNLAVLTAALGVFGTGTAWPDLLVASLMASLALQSGWAVLRQARQELATGQVAVDPHDHARWRALAYTDARGHAQPHRRTTKYSAACAIAHTTPDTTASANAARAVPASTHRPSRSSTPSASTLMASAGRVLPSGMGSDSTTASTRQSRPMAYSSGGCVSRPQRGRRSFSARASQGRMRRTSVCRSSRARERRAMTPGSQGRRPSMSCAPRKINGAPRMAETPGGTGITLGTANTNISAPIARSPSAASRSPMLMRSEVPSCASRNSTSDSG